ncbi:uncharacterized protein [Nicotiana sylvestris]|uniref:Uncharacterized protein LOC104248932 n=1 Tax=Nicotiana sylvestris TaxID=4096 RepID=A0A1U7YKE7_NICSY|nr:PREDICTED: uncharacterized protein LOC104248932 [Nicotiana sylvestris]
MANRFGAFNTGKGLLQVETDDDETNVVRRNILVNLENTFNLFPNPNSASISTRNISLTISPHPATIYISPPPIPPKFTISPEALPVIMMTNAQSYALATSVTESQQNQLALCPYKRPGKEIKTTSWDDPDRELHNLRKIVEEEMRARNIQILRYESLCMHPNVELPPGFKIPKFNTFNGKGYPIYHLKDYCNRLVGIGHNEAIRMKLFIQSLTGLALDWYTQQNLSKWYMWEDITRDFVEQYKFYNGDSPTLCDMREVERMQYESFAEYAMRWRLEATKIRPQLPENELISTFIKMQKGIYYEKLLCARLHDFSNLTRVGKLIESSIRAGRIVDKSKLQATSQGDALENLQGKKRKIDSVCIPAHQP